MNPRARRHVNTGFKSIRDLLIFALGAWTFWFQTTRVAEPSLRVLGACVLMMITPTATSLYRVVNALYGTSGRLLRELEREKEDKA